MRQRLEEIQTSFPEHNVSFKKENTTEYGVEYKVQYLEEENGTEEENMSQIFFHSAKLIVLKEEAEKDTAQQKTAFICTAEDGTRLSKETDSVKVLFTGHDLDGLRLSDLKKMGYEVQNEQMLAMEEYDMKIRLFHIQYGMLICVVCLVTLYYMKKNVPEYNYYD